MWTLPVWESERALVDLVAKVSHGEVMKERTPNMAARSFAGSKLLGSGVPPRGKDAVRRSVQES